MSDPQRELDLYFGYWRGSPELLAQIFRAAQQAVSEASTVEPSTQILLWVHDDCEAYDSPESFALTVSGESLARLSRIQVAVDGDSAGITIELTRAASSWSQFNPFGGAGDGLWVTASGRVSESDLVTLVGPVARTVKRGVPWWGWGSTGTNAAHARIQELRLPWWTRRFQRFIDAADIALASLLSACVGAALAAAVGYLGGLPSYFKPVMVVASAATLMCWLRWVRPDVEVARFRQRRLDKVWRQGSRVAVTLALAVITKQLKRS